MFEAMATFVGQVSVLSLIAIFGAATTAMVRSSSSSIVSFKRRVLPLTNRVRVMIVY